MSDLALSVEELTSERASRGLQVAIVGVGAAGTHLLSNAISGGVSPKDCVAVGTDPDQLAESRAQNKVLLTESICRNSPLNAQSMAYRVTPFTRGSDFAILLAGLGGFTGTVAAPAIAQLNRSHVRPVVSVVALPFFHERERRFVALRGLKRMVESCDCTVVIDNAVERRANSDFVRGADELCGLAVRALSEVVSVVSPMVTQRILGILGLGQIATVCVAPMGLDERVQSVIIDALGMPSANLALSKAKGAVVLLRGLEPLSTGQAAQVYEAVASLVGHDIEFVQVNAGSAPSPSVLVFLSGYSYEIALGAFTDLIEDLYDIEYGVPRDRVKISLPVGLYEMEGF